MKRLFVLITLLCLCGCQALAAKRPQTEPVQPLTPETNASLSTDPPVKEETSASTFRDEATEPAAIAYRSGDTTPGWRPELANAYPADDDCDAELLLEKWMAVEGLTQAELDARDCGQLILVAAQPTDGVESLTLCYERGADGSFTPVDALPPMRGHVGKNGIMHDRRRNTETSPAGLWPIESAFGNAAPPEGLKLSWRQVTPNSDWVCDESSPYFNTWQERGDPALLPWSDDVEHLENYPELYAYACVLGFNRPPDTVPDRGCAIFLHCSERGTGGCVGLLREDMLAVLRWLDPAQQPCILITGVQRDEA